MKKGQRIYLCPLPRKVNWLIDIFSIAYNKENVKYFFILFLPIKVVNLIKYSVNYVHSKRTGVYSCPIDIYNSSISKYGKSAKKLKSVESQSTYSLLNLS